jgi:hypothetical protein
MLPTPAPDTRRLLHEIVVAWRQLVLDLRAADPAAPLGRPFVSAVWASRSGQPAQLQFAKYQLPSLLEELLAAEGHLTKTCRETHVLAQALHVIALDQLADSRDQLPRPELLDRVTDFILARLFEAEFTRRLYFRIYNLKLDESPLQLPFAGASLDDVLDWDIPAITGETTPTSTLHIRNTGNVFLLFEDRGPDDDMQWWRARWSDANNLLQVFQYFRYAVIDIDYSVIHFTPDWLNEVRRYGIAMWGRPRTDVQPTRYILAKGEDRTLLRYLAAVARFKPLLEDLTPTLRRAIATAGDYYEGHHKRTSAEDQLIDLVIALEALFSPKEKTELRFRISHRAALLLGDAPDARRSIGQFLRKVYDGRSALVHEGKSPFVPQIRSGKQRPPNLTPDDLRRVGDLVMQAILRLSVLYGRGDRDREQSLKSIEDCAYDPEALSKLAQRTDLDTFLREQEL